MLLIPMQGCLRIEESSMAYTMYDQPSLDSVAPAMLSGAQTMVARFQAINQRFTEILMRE